MASCRTGGVGVPCIRRGWCAQREPGGAPPPRTLDEADASLFASLDAVLAGNTGGLERPTPIRDARSGIGLRD